MCTKNRKAEFINNEIWILTFGGGLQRTGTYSVGIIKPQKDAFRNSVRGEISRLVNAQYVNAQVTSEAHIQNLIKLQNWINANHANVLREGGIRFGVVQKLLNLYLKYQWCLGLIEMPPHCPFDSIIIGELNLPEEIHWTLLETVEEYEMLVTAAFGLAEAAQKSIAEWELAIFRRRNVD